MAAPVKIRSSVGFRSATIYEIDQTTGLPAATSITPYDGIQVIGSNALNVTFPESRQIEHVGDDFVMLLDLLPPNTAATGELVVASTNDTIDAAVTGNKSYAIGDTNFINIATALQGFEPQVAVVAYRESAANDPSNASLGQRLWDFRIFPRSYLIPRETSYDANPELHPYTFRPQFINQHLWGVAFANSVEGSKRAQWIRGVRRLRPHIVAWKQTGVGAVFAFSTDFPCGDTTSATFWTNGVLEVAPTTTSTQTTLASPPASNAIIVGYYGV
jgi:hypothetical protein